MSEKREPRPDEAREPESRQDGAFARTLARHYAPAPLSAARRAALDEELRRRVERPGPWVRWAPGLAAAALAAVAWWSWPGAPAPEPERSADAAAVWEQELFYAGDAVGEAEGLPDDFRAIAVAFLGAEG